MSLYSVFDYGAMSADRVRMDAFIRALRSHVRPDSIVLDIGTGTGIFALLACKLGARRVYAIEPDDAIQVARDLAAANGFAERIEFFQKLSTEVTLPQRADIMISDLGGLLPWFQRHIPSIIDARRRLLGPGAIMIPQLDTAWAALVEATEFYARYTDGWDGAHFGLDLAAGRNIALNTLRRYRPAPEQFLTPPQCWARLDYATVTSASAQAEVSWTVERPGTAHGLCVWCDRRLADGIEICNAPAPPGTHTPTIYAPLFFPLAEPVQLTAGAVVVVKLAANLVGADYVWRWDTQVWHGAQCQANFRQSTFHSVALSADSLRKRSANYRAQLNGEGKLDSFVLAEMAQQPTLSEIAHLLLRRFPERFADWQSALDHVSDVAQRYCGCSDAGQ